MQKNGITLDDSWWLLKSHNFTYHYPSEVLKMFNCKSTYRKCKKCGTSISNREIYIEAYNPVWDDAFTALLWFCIPCGKKIAEFLNIKIKE